MNKIIILLILSAVFITSGVLAQIPEKMSYQAVVRNNKNELVSNKQIGLRISIIQGNINGPKVYREIFSPNPVTNANGLFTAEIGSGTAITGTFTSIDWANGPYFIQSEIDTTGGTNYTLTGTTQLLSVPYALHAKTAETLSGTFSETDPAFAAWDKDYNDLSNKPDLSNYATKDMIYPNPVTFDYNDLINKPDLSNYATIDMLNQNPTSLDYNDLINKPDLSNYATIDMINQNSANTDYNDLINKPDLSIYATKNMANQNITHLADPVHAQDAATKAYVDALLKKIDKLINDNLLSEGFFDVRDSTHYNMVKIGNQIWMAENLKYLPESTDWEYSNTEPRYAVNVWSDSLNVNDAKETYGVLYNWTAAMNGALPSSSNPSGVQGVCPDGWHLPSYAEWEQLVEYLGGDSIAGGKLKQTGTKYWESPNTGATNESGFTALPGGDVNLDVIPVMAVGHIGIWWSASWNNTYPTDYFPSLEYNSNIVRWGERYRGCCNVQDYKSFGFSVRCIKD